MKKNEKIEDTEYSTSIIPDSIDFDFKKFLVKQQRIEVKCSYLKLETESYVAWFTV